MPSSSLESPFSTCVVCPASDQKLWLNNGLQDTDAQQHTMEEEFVPRICIFDQFLDLLYLPMKNR